METNTASNIREPNDFVRQFMEIVNVSARYIDKQIKSSCFEYYTLILSHGVCYTLIKGGKKIPSFNNYTIVVISCLY